MTSQRADQRRRLTIFSGAWYPREGGAEAQLRQVATDLAAMGWSVKIVAGAAHADTLRSVNDGSLDVVRITPGKQDVDSVATGPELLARATVVGLRTRPEVVVCSLVSAASIAGMTVARLGRVPALLRIGGHDLDRHTQTWAGRTQGKYLVRRASVVVVNAGHLSSQVTPFASRGRPLVLVIRNGIDVSTQPASTVRSGTTTVAYYTNGGAPKNDPDFLQVVRACPDLRFRAMGTTGHLEDLPNLTRLGWVDDVSAELARADVVVNTSFSEGSPNFCMQALAVGRPVVGFDNGGVTDLAREWPDDVETVPMGDVAALASLLHRSGWRTRVVTAAIPKRSDIAREWDATLSRCLVRR